MNGSRVLYNKKELARRLLRAAPFQRCGKHWRFGTRTIRTVTVERMIAAGEARRDGDLIRPTAALERR